MRRALFLLTAVVTGYETFGHMIMAVCGSVGLNLSPMAMLPLAGSSLLLISGMLPYRWRAMRWLSLIGCCILWLRYFPGMIFYILSIIHGRDYYDLLLFVPPLLLLLTTMTVVEFFRKKNDLNTAAPIRNPVPERPAQ